MNNNLIILNLLILNFSKCKSILLNNEKLDQVYEMIKGYMPDPSISSSLGDFDSDSFLQFQEDYENQFQDFNNFDSINNELKNDELKREKLHSHWEHLFTQVDLEFGQESIDDEFKELEHFAPKAFGVALTQSKSRILQALSNYGCWCNFDDTTTPYGGEPVDNFDRACQMLQQGYRCIKLDLGNTCNPIDVKYKISTKYIHGEESIMVDKLQKNCKRTNTDKSKTPTEKECSYDLCTVEAYFVNSIYKLLMTGNRIDLTKSHKRGFQPETVCKPKVAATKPHMFNDNYDDSEDSEMSGDFITPNKNEKTTTTPPTTTTPTPPNKDENLQSESSENPTENFQSSLDKTQSLKNKNPKRKDTCCGVYPKRLPFNAAGNSGTQKDCCDNRVIFNVISQMCCDGVVTDVGVC